MFKEITIPSVPIAPFFDIELCLHQIQGEQFSVIHRLPETSLLTREQKLADVSGGWSREGLYFLIKFEQPLKTKAHIHLFFHFTGSEKTGGHDLHTHYFSFNTDEEFGQEHGTTLLRKNTPSQTKDPLPLIQRETSSFMIFLSSNILVHYRGESGSMFRFFYFIEGGHGKVQSFYLPCQKLFSQKHPEIWPKLQLDI